MHAYIMHENTWRYFNTNVLILFVLYNKNCIEACATLDQSKNKKQKNKKKTQQG